MSNKCNMCYKEKNNGELIITCNKCSKLICEECFSGDLLGGMMCRLCLIQKMKNKIYSLFETIDYLRYEIEELENIKP